MHPLIAQFQHSLLGRLRTKIFAKITGNNDQIPGDRELWKSIMADWKQDPIGARVRFHLLNVHKNHLISLPSQISRQQVRATLRHVAQQKAPLNQYVEIDREKSEEHRGLGCLLMGHQQTSGDPGYYAAVLTEEGFPAFTYVSIVPPTKNGESFISIWRPDGWHDLTATEAGMLEATRIAIAALARVPDSRGRGILLDSERNLSSVDEPPVDPEYMRRVKLVLRRKLQITKGDVASTAIELFTPEFQAELNRSIVDRIAQDIPKEQHELLVYWDGRRFVCSDDYYSLLAYRSLSHEQIPVVIMGDFPPDLVDSPLPGSRNDLPAVTMLSVKRFVGDTNELRTWQAERKEAQRLIPPGDLMAAWIGFASLLAKKNVSEREVHEFITENPLLLGSNWDDVQAEVRLGTTFKADFVLRADRAMPTVRLVELERAGHRIFTRDLHETDEVTHAVQQVNDWQRWWKQNSTHPIAIQSRGVEPEGLVVIGRSSALTEREREVLAHNNQGRRIQVRTYDELLDDFGTLILHRLDSEGK